MPDQPIRIWRTPYSDFYDDETRTADEAYSREHLQALADEGFTAVWLRGILRDVVRTDVFPELGENADEHLDALGTLIDRADDVGMGVWLYVQPPLALDPDDPFWDRHPEARGITQDRGNWGPRTSMCVSNPDVQRFLREGFETLSRELPGLGGTILITASEHLQHCYTGFSREQAAAGESTGCERCDQREPKNVIADIVRNAREGFSRAGNGAEIVSWNWSWNAYEDEPQREIIEELPEDVVLMAGFERGDSKRILGRERPIDEYSLSFAGPSDRFVRAIETGRSRGMDGMAKLQMATTHELATVPNLPVIGTIYDKAAGMRDNGVDHFMGCWNFGNMLCSNTAAFLRFLDADPLPPRDEALTNFAASYFPECDPDGVVDAWITFEEAMDFYPFSIPFVYNGPLNHAMVRPIEPGPLDERPVGPSWLRDDSRGDELEASFGPYTLDEIVAGLGQVWRTWMDGAATFDRAVANCSAETATDESNTARVAGHCFHSGWNLFRAYRLREDWSSDRRGALREIVRDERDHLDEVLPIVAEDDRMGFHSECQHYMFDAEGMRKKIADLNDHLD